jgi:predicted HTH transcriptional regulator
MFDNSDTLDELSYRMLIEDFATTLDRCDQIILEVYLNKGKTTQREIAEHFKIDSTSAWLYLKNIKCKLKEYVKTKEGI